MKVMGLKNVCALFALSSFAIVQVCGLPLHKRLISPKKTGGLVENPYYVANKKSKDLEEDETAPEVQVLDPALLQMLFQLYPEIDEDEEVGGGGEQQLSSAEEGRVLAHPSTNQNEAAADGGGKEDSENGDDDPMSQLEEIVLKKHQRKLQFKWMQDQLQEERDLAMELLKIYEQESDLLDSSNILEPSSEEDVAARLPTFKSSATKRSSKTKNKKDMEYLAYQADPGLTVRDLSWRPKINFRKETANNFAAEDDDAKDEEDKWLLSPAARGMKEAVLPRPDDDEDELFAAVAAVPPPPPPSKTNGNNSQQQQSRQEDLYRIHKEEEDQLQNLKHFQPNSS